MPPGGDFLHLALRRLVGVLSHNKAKTDVGGRMSW